MRPGTDWRNVKHARPLRSCAWGNRARSCLCCGTAPTRGFVASSSTGCFPWESIRRRIVAELDRIDPSATPTPGPAHQSMDDMLFHPETSQRRALILSLGTYGAEDLPGGPSQSLVERLIDLYRNDPDAGIHGAAEWTLRQWKQHEKLKSLDAELINVKDWGRRRWYMNGQGQTFALIEGPVEFRMGSPPAETERIPGNEPQSSCANSPPFRHRCEGGHGRAIPAVPETRRHHH